MSNHVDGKLYNVTVQTYIQEVTTSIKFPCVFFIQWRTNDHKSSTQSAKHSPQGDKVVFDQSITLKTNIIYDKQKKIFCKKESQLQLNLISKSRPDQPKLVGRLTFDLATFLNQNPYAALTQIPLNFCSVNAFIVLSVKVIQKIETDISVYEHQKSLNEGPSFASSIKVSTPNFGLEKSKQNFSIMKESSQVSSRIYQAVTLKKEYMGSIASPRSIEQNGFRIENEVIQVKQTTPKTTMKDIRSILDEKIKSKSFKTAKTEEGPNFDSRIVEATVSQVDKQQVLRFKAQLQSLKIQSSKKWQEQQRNRFQLQNKIKESQFTKLQLRQKQGQIDQANAQVNLLKNENTRLREENSKLKDESVKLTLKLSEIRDGTNKSQQQLLTLERQLKRYEKIDQTYNSTNQTNKQLTNQIVNLKKQLNDSEKLINSLKKQKVQFQQLINLKQAQYQNRYEQWQQQRTNQTSSKQSLLIQLSNAQQKCRAESNLRNILQAKVNQMQQQISRLTEISNEFLQAKNSWQITEGIHKDEIDSKKIRIAELEETIISTGDRVRWLEGEVQILEQSNKKSRQQNLKLQQQKNKQKEQLIAQIHKMSQFIRQLNETILKVQNQKNELITTINSLIQKYDQLNKQYEAQITQNAALLQNYDQKLKSLNQYKQRCAQFEQLLLSSNQMRQKQSAESAQKQKNMYLRIIQLQSQVTNANDHILIDQDRIQMLDSELKNRQDLVSKLEVGLQRQIQRSEDLNVKLLGYMERAEKMKDIMAAMQEQHRRIMNFIEEQEISQFRNKNKIQEKQRSILQLLINLQQSLKYGKELQETLRIRESQYRIQMDSLNVQLNELNSKVEQFQQIAKNNGAYIVLLQNNLANNNQLLADKDKKTQQTELKYNQDIQVFKQGKAQLHLHMLDLQNEVSRLNQIIAQKDIQLNEKGSKFDGISEQLFIQQAQKAVLSTKITQLQTMINQFNNQINDLKNEVSLKQEMLQQQANRYNQLEAQYAELQKDQATLDIIQHKQVLQERNQTIRLLQQKIQNLQKQNSKISALERSIKIKTIQLNSMKFKGKGQPAESNQLLKLKDQEIASLLSQKQKLLIFQTQCAKLRQKILELQSEIELIEEEKFNIESESNEKALILQQTKQENRKLIQQITIIGQKNSELQRIITEISSTQNIQRNKTLLMTFRPTVTDNKRVRQEVEGASNSLNLLTVLKQVKQTMDQRLKNRLSDKLLQTFDRISVKQALKDSSVQAKLKSLSKDFSKLKLLLIKILENNVGPQKTSFLQQIRSCETVIGSVLNALQ